MTNMERAQAERVEQYPELMAQIKSMIESEPDPLANICNVIALLKTRFNFWWVGIYIVRGNELVLGPFQGPPACTRIAKGRGVCGVAWQEARSIRVDNVEEFDGHIACSSESKSEIVLPLFSFATDSVSPEVIGVLDIDSVNIGEFCDRDVDEIAFVAEEIASLLCRSNFKMVKA